jgi:hypothetical protein
MRQPDHKHPSGLRSLVGLAVLGVLTQCTPPGVVPRPPPVSVQNQTPLLTPEEQLELFNRFVDQG